MIRQFLNIRVLYILVLILICKKKKFEFIEVKFFLQGRIEF